MLDGRDGKSLRRWLKKHKKIQKVARDRANAFSAVISEVLPNCIQIADRFHLVDNISTYLEKILRSVLPKCIFIKNNEICKYTPKKIKVKYRTLSSEDLKSLNYDDTPPVDENGLIISYNRRAIWIDSLEYKRQKKTRKARKKLILEIKKEASLEGLTAEEIAVNYKLNIPMVRRYLNMTPEKIKELDTYVGKRRKTAIDGYANIIYKMMVAGYPDMTIFSYVLSKGYNKNQSTLWHYMYCISKNNFPGRETESQRHFGQKMEYPKDVTVIKKEYLIVKLFKNNNKFDYKDIIESAFPVVRRASEIYTEFHSAIMGTKTKSMDDFLDKYENSEIATFCTKIKEDIAAVHAAISSPISSGFVEGNNNKIKLLERIVYGRTNFSKFFKKCRLAFLESTGKLNLNEFLEY